MLEKKTINIDIEEQMRETTTIQDKNGNSVNILKRISCADKEAFVQELASMAISSDEKTGLCYVNALFNVAYNYLFVTHYTDIDTEWVKDVEDFRKLYDYCLINGICDTCTPENEKDADNLRECWWRYSQAVIQLYEKEHSLEQMAKTIFDTNFTMQNDEMRKLMEQLIDMKKTLKEKPEQPVQNIGGGILNFAKR